MKEKDLLKSAADLQMPDLEQIRQNVLNSNGQTKDVKPKIIKLKPSRLLAVAAIVALAVVGTIAAVANQNGGLFAPATEPTTAAATTQPTTSAQKAKKNTSAKTSKAKKLSESERQAALNKKFKNSLSSNGYSVTKLFDLGEIEDYHIVYAGNGITASYNCDYIIGSYTFRTGIQQNPYGLGLYACGKDKSYTLADSYTQGIFENFSDAVDLIKDHSMLNLGLEVIENNPNSESFRGYLNEDIISLSKISEGDGYELYFTIPDHAPQSSKGKIIDDYSFTLKAEQPHYDLGLFVVSGGTINTLEKAVDNGTVGMGSVYDAIIGNSSVPFSFKIYPPEEDDEEVEETTEAPAEEEEVTEEE